MWICGGPKTFDADIVPRIASNVKDNRARKGGELYMSETLVIIAVWAAGWCIMKINEALDAPEKDRRKRA